MRVRGLLLPPDTSGSPRTLSASNVRLEIGSGNLTFGAKSGITSGSVFAYVAGAIEMLPGSAVHVHATTSLAATHAAGALALPGARLFARRALTLTGVRLDAWAGAAIVVEDSATLSTVVNLTGMQSCAIFCGFLV